MSIALDRGGERRFEGSGYMRGMACMNMFESPEILAGEQRVLASDVSGKVEERSGEEGGLEDSCSSSSSIGKNSDDLCSDGEDSRESIEVQSSYKGPLDALDALEEVLPIRRGISRFYSGKSKSFASLAEAASSSSNIKDIAKPENAYTRKRRNLLAYSQVWDKNRNFPLRSNGGGISKRPLHSSRSTLALAVAMSSSDSSNSCTTTDDSSPNSNSSSRSPPRRPPLHPHIKPALLQNNSSPSSPRGNFTSWRSFSLADLQQCAAAAAVSNTSPSPVGDTADHSKRLT
ncbi:protein OXIDATIVE STRESS 3 LIKE 1 [Malania oleifera]|uniref:protein OXIDATIVE STRESS 3 LIKE 1 n=1 Tax=Malania oleifera TaxID=397392 RepID=UPI0025ADF559|nr:protein OXIDATIVE STRESS 3 LIKE 1 [Malania oleifera]